MSHATVANWVAILERLYALFRFPPFDAPQIRAVKDVELRYFRDVDGREVDFVVVEGRQPTHLIECRWSDAPVDPGDSGTWGRASRTPKPGRYPRSAPRTI